VSERGFSLVELLVAAAIGSVVMLGLSGFYLSALRFNAESSAQTYLQRQGALVLDEMARQIRPATAIVIATCSGDANSLRITNAAPGGGTQTVCFHRNGSRLLEDLPGGTRDLLSGSPAPLTATAFSASINGTAVAVSFQLRDQTFTAYDRSRDQLSFATTFTKRN
jgi:prepilin-type N-terminal cleavage/methylation domain-containing protein